MGIKDARTKKKSGLPETKLKTTRWSEAAARGETLKEYPRPGMKRSEWINLNGWWDFVITSIAEPSVPKFGSFPSRKILVPFSPESELSGVHIQLRPGMYLWYYRKITLPEIPEGWHYLLHFGAVDQTCQVYVDGVLVGSHEGGYLPFSIDLMRANKEMELVVRVQDVSDTSYHSRGKQKLNRGGMYYTAQSGIWQTVWMEAVPNRYIKKLKIDANPDSGTVLIRKTIHEGGKDHLITENRHVDYLHLWSPEDPYLYPITITEGEDRVESYFAFRKLEIRQDANGYPRFWLNGNICIQTGVLDQGYWCDGLYTAPSDEALIYDIQSMKDMGFNMIRKHIKIEPERWYYHCDRLGMLVWQDMVSGGRPYKDWFVTYLATVMNVYHLPFKDGAFSRRLLSRTDREGRDEFLKETEETISHLYNHPSIVAWVPFNEGWGQFEAKKVCSFVRKMDSERWIDHASGWYDQKAGDMVSLHHYFFGLHFKAEKKRVLALTEFGGYTWQVPDHSFSEDLYGYGGYNSKEELTLAYEKLYAEEVISNIERGISAFVYTQLSDVEEEANGMITYDREVIKLECEKVRTINETVKNMIK